MTVIDRLGGNLPRGPVTVELDDIQATVLRYRPEPYYGTHVMLHVDDARGRPRVPAQAGAARRLRRRVVAGRRAVDRGRDHLLGSGGAGRTGGVTAELSRSVPGGDGRARAQAPRQRRERPGALGAAVRKRAIHIGVSVFSDSEETWRRTMDTARQHYEGCPGLTVLSDGGLRRPAGRPEPAGLQGLDRSARDRGQRRRAAARPGTSDQGGRVHPRLSRRGRRTASRRHSRTCWDATAPTSGLRKYQTRVGAFNRFLHAHAHTDEERELLAAKLVGRWRSGAPLTLAPDHDDPELGADPLRNNDFTYAADPHGRQVPLGAHMRRMNPRDSEMALLVDVNIHRIIRRSTTYGAPYDPDARSRRRTTRPPAGSTSSSSAPRRWPRWSSSSRSGSTTATS